MTRKTVLNLLKDPLNELLESVLEGLEDPLKDITEAFKGPY